MIAIPGAIFSESFLAYIGLGSMTGPQTFWTSTGAQEQVTFDLGEKQDFSLMYYGGITSRNFTMGTEKNSSSGVMIARSA